MTTKRIARLTGRTTAEVNALARDLQIFLIYNPAARSWETRTAAEGRALIDHINALAA